MANSNRRRDWFLTVPARVDKCKCLGSKHTCAFDKLMIEKALSGVGYTGQMEQGKNGFMHWQLFINQKNQLSFDALRKRFERVSKHGINIEVPRDKWQSQEYCRKADTRVGDQITSPAYVPVKQAAKAKKVGLDDAHAMVLAGRTVDSLLLEMPMSFSQIRALREVEAAYNAKMAKNRPFSPLTVHYWYGPPGVGKSYGVYSSVPRQDLYVAADRHIWDGYTREKVVLLDEFSDARLSLTELLNALDQYTPTLPARYHNKVGVYDEVYILSNVALDQHYQDESSERFNALCRRITDYRWFPGVKKESVAVDLPYRR